MAGNFKMDDYVDVAQRIHDFYERYPGGRLTMGSPPQVMEIGGKPYIWYHARAYRDAEDVFPGDGWAAEPVPGPTLFTKDSELMNAETAAWGRAIVALGFSTKKIASAQEVKARQPDTGLAAAKPAVPPAETHDLVVLQAKLLELAAEYGMELQPLRDKIEAQKQRPGFVDWLHRQIAAAESSLELRKAQEQADREAQVESPAFQAPTTKRGQKAAA